MKLLFAEDDQDLAAAVKTLLERNGYLVDVVYDGQEAVDYAAAENYDGMIMDWQLYRSGELADENAVEGIWYDEEAGLLVFDLLSARTDSTDGLALVPVLADETVDLDHAISLTVEP